MNKVKKALAALSALAGVALVFSSVAFAMGDGQIERGDFYRIKNETKNVDFSDPASAGPCETLVYKARLHNPGPGKVKNVNVKVNLPSNSSTQNVSTFTVTAENAFPASATDTATLNLSQSLKVNYVSGSSQLLDHSGNVIRGISDVTSGSGVNIGDIDVSLNEKRFVQFKAKTDCVKPPCKENPNAPGCNPCKDNPNAPECNPCKNNPNLPQCNPCKNNPNKPGCNPCKDNPDLPQCQPCKNNPQLPECQPCSENPNNPECNPQCEDDLNTPEDECNPTTPPTTPGSPTTPTTPSAPGSLPDTGPGGVAAVFSIVSIAGMAAYRVFIRRFGIEAQATDNFREEMGVDKWWRKTQKSATLTLVSYKNEH